MASQAVVPKKKRGPQPSGKGVQVQVRTHEPLLEALDRWLSTHPYVESRAGAYRSLAEEGLKRCGIIGPDGK